MAWEFLNGPQQWDQQIARLLQAGRCEEEEPEAEEEAPVFAARRPVEPPEPAPEERPRPGIQCFTAAELAAREEPPCRWTVPELLPSGLALLGGKPKQGKSWLALSLACAVAGKGRFLGQPAETGDVLYLALEDTPRRLKARLDRLRAAGLEGTARLTFAVAWPSLGQGGGAALHQWLNEHLEARLVIIDTLARLRPPQRGKGSVYQEEYDVMAALKQVADRHDVAVLVVHHLRKQGADDEFDTINGTTGLTGAPDTIWILNRLRGRSEATLWVTSRDVEEHQLALRFDAGSCRWHSLGRASEAPMSEQRQAVLNLLALASLTPLQLAEQLGIGHSAAKTMLHRMAADGQVVPHGGRYSLPASAWTGHPDTGEG
jgi:hypothetical protein